MNEKQNAEQSQEAQAAGSELKARLGPPCAMAEWNECCCTCEHHLRDFHHCTTLGQINGKCTCNDPKGWICVPPEFEGAHSGWAEHGLCEMYSKRP